MAESKFQRNLIRELKELYPGLVILKNDSGYQQGIPDLTLLFEDRWANLEAKDSAKAAHQPNQDYWVERLNEMSYSSFIYPENKEEVLDAIQQTLRPRW